VRSPIEVKLGGDLGLVSQLSVHVLFQDLIVFYIVNKKQNKKQQKQRRNRENRGFTKLAFSPPC
jgi:hypothetical protein